MEHVQVVLQQDQIRRLLRDVDGGIDRQPDVGRMQRGRVVDAVAQEAHDTAPPAQRLDDAVLLRRIDAAEHVRIDRARGERMLVEARDFAAGQHARDRHAELRADVPRHALVVAGQDLHRHAGVAQRIDRASRARLRRIEERHEADEGEVAFVARRNAVAIARHRLGRDREHAQAVGAQRLPAPLGALARRGVECVGPRRCARLVARRKPEDFLGGALDDQQPRLAVVGQHGHAPPLEVERRLVDLREGVRFDALVREDRPVERAPDARLEPAVHPGEQQHARAVAAVDVDVRRERDVRLGERARLVGAEDVHRAEVLDRCEPLDDHALARHPHRAARERDRDDHRQQLRRQSDRQRDGEEERFEPRLVGERVHHQHEQHHQHGEAHDQHAEATRAGVERGGRRLADERRGELADRRVVARAIHEKPPGSAHHRRPHEERVRCRGELGLRRHRRLRALLHGEGLPGQQRLVDVQVARLEQDPVARGQVPGGEKHDVAGNDLRHRNALRRAVAHDARAHLHRAAQPPRRLARAIFLHEVERHADDHERDDDAEAREFAGRRRDDARGEQDHHQRIAEAGEELDRHRALGPVA